MQKFKKLLFLITSTERKRAGLLLIMIIILALLETLGVGSILPFISVLSNPSLVQTNDVLKAMYQASGIFGIKTNEEFLFALGALVYILFAISVIFKFFTNYLQIRFVYMQEHSIGKRLIEGYLHQPYSWFLSRNSADLGKNIFSEINQVIVYGFSPLIELIAKGTIAIAIITLLLIVEPKLALIVGLSLTASYVLIFYFVRNYLNRSGKELSTNNQLRFRIVSEAFGAVKEIKIGGLEQKYIKNFSNSAQIFASSQASASIISQSPRYVLEIIAFGGILSIMYYIMIQTGSLNNALPVVSLYVFAGYRLIPALQQIYGSLANLTFVGPSLKKLYEDLENCKPYMEKQDQRALSFNKAIMLKNIHYNYPNTSQSVLKDINIIIPAKSSIGIVGATGSGKTTTVDIILGLLEPQKGFIEIDGKIITKNNVRSWQRSIGYVPQYIYLSDDTVASNIAFREDPKDINKEMVEKASKIANLHEFVMDKLPKQYQTRVGERGIKLSGGERQRIGIARALYHNPRLLIFDEATSALDNQTEQLVMDAINSIRKNITIIMIAHRLNTVKNCDIIFKLDKGQVVSQGTFNNLINNN
jgi:ABC-type bacteriocin/lantibiotic exporter with double-glycine peptidase domain